MSLADVYAPALPHFAHQAETFAASVEREQFGLLWEMGCVDADTEFLSPEGWRRIDQWNGHRVAQWDQETGTARFVEPERYIKLPCDEMLHIKTRYGVDQVLSLDHKVPGVHGEAARGKSYVWTARELEQLLQGSSNPESHRSLPCRFHLSLSGPGLGLAEQELRLLIAVMADGSFPKSAPHTLRCTVRLKKRRKIERLEWLLEGADYKKRHDPQTGFYIYRFKSPMRCKSFADTDFWGLISDQDRSVILDEIFCWDGSGSTYYSRHEADADFVQFLGGSAGYVCRKFFSGGVWCVNFRRSKNTFCIKARNLSRTPSPDGLKYCFTVPSGFLVLRRNGCVFPTGNCGKSKTLIDTACALYEAGEIDAALGVAPNGVHLNWATDELPKHVPERLQDAAQAFAYAAGRAGTRWHQRAVTELLRAPFPWLLISYDAFITDRGKKAVWAFLRARRALYFLDESDAIKTPGAKRTKSIVASGRYARYKRILTGTPIPNSPFDVYSQLRFLDEDFWRARGFGSYAAFKSHFGIWETGYNGQQGREFAHCVAYRNLEQLHDTVDEISSRLQKEDVLDLPEKLYSKRYFEMTAKQRAAYEQMREAALLEFEDGAELTADLAIVRLLRLHQITCGYVPDDECERLRLIDDKNPRLEALMAQVAETVGQGIIWARFRQDIDLIMARLGERAVRYDGSVSDDERLRARRAFQAGDVQWFVGNPAAGGTGLTLTQAKTVIYYNNSFRLRDRLQSEDRAHRIGQAHAVLYVDLIAPGTVDDYIVNNLRAKRDVASVILGDQLGEWL